MQEVGRAVIIVRDSHASSGQVIKRRWEDFPIGMTGQVAGASVGPLLGSQQSQPTAGAQIIANPVPTTPLPWWGRAP